MEDFAKLIAAGFISLCLLLIGAMVAVFAYLGLTVMVLGREAVKVSKQIRGGSDADRNS